LTKSDREWFEEYLRNQIKEEETNAWRYKTEEQYERLAKIKRIYNILSYENPEAAAGKEKFINGQKSHQ
tara:strand:+ start:1675 stop:1881 length:207 start_codon:yes stop_codon:yes gene_type:complete